MSDPLDSLIIMARQRYAAMSPREKARMQEAQCESWVRGEFGMGSDADEARYAAAGPEERKRLDRESRARVDRIFSDYKKTHDSIITAAYVRRVHKILSLDETFDAAWIYLDVLRVWSFRHPSLYPPIKQLVEPNCAEELECPMFTLPFGISGYDGEIDSYYCTTPDPCGRDR